MLGMQPIQWNPGMENPAFGRIQLVQNVGEDGKPLYPQPLISETRGEVDFIVDTLGRIAFVESERHAVLDPALYAQDWGRPAPDYFSFPEEQRGMVILELPRGFAGAVMQEAEEEARFRVADPEVIGHVNANTAFYATSPFVAVGRATEEPTDRELEPNERIRAVRWLTPEETRDVKTLDSFTHGVLHLVRSWALNHSNPKWVQFGERM